MAKRRNSYERKWIENFIRSPLVDRKEHKFRQSFAQQLFSGRYGDDYPEEYPSNFQQFYNLLYDRERHECIDTALRFLNFIGIQLTREQVEQHLEKMPSDYEVFLRKTYYLLRTLARSDDV
ncbi:MAG TPA: hypothetical protein VD927_16545 [Chryseosolibacter sp.]|nr:hypothetical protein [Chryseosolibacter sp.]